jgi:hypothetical protein
MITNVSLTTIWVTDLDEAEASTSTSGFQESADLTMGDGYRWLNATRPPEIGSPHAPAPLDESAESFRRMLAKHPRRLGLATDDACHPTAAGRQGSSSSRSGGPAGVEATCATTGQRLVSSRRRLDPSAGDWPG